MIYFWDDEPPTNKELEQEALKRLLNKQKERIPKCSCKDMDEGCIC